jgi:hypothetical protein
VPAKNFVSTDNGTCSADGILHALAVVDTQVGLDEGNGGEHGYHCWLKLLEDLCNPWKSPSFFLMRLSTRPEVPDTAILNIRNHVGPSGDIPQGHPSNPWIFLESHPCRP